MRSDAKEFSFLFVCSIFRVKISDFWKRMLCKFIHKKNYFLLLFFFFLLSQIPNRSLFELSIDLLWFNDLSFFLKKKNTKWFDEFWKQGTKVLFWENLVWFNEILISKKGTKFCEISLWNFFGGKKKKKERNFAKFFFGNKISIFLDLVVLKQEIKFEEHFFLAKQWILSKIIFMVEIKNKSQDCQNGHTYNKITCY